MKKNIAEIYKNLTDILPERSGFVFCKPSILPVQEVAVYSGSETKQVGVCSPCSLPYPESRSGWKSPEKVSFQGCNEPGGRAPVYRGGFNTHTPPTHSPTQEEC